MFRKYYHSLNEQILPSGKLIDSTIEQMYDAMNETLKPRGSHWLRLALPVCFLFCVLIALPFLINYNIPKKDRANLTGAPLAEQENQEIALEDSALTENSSDAKSSSSEKILTPLNSESHLEQVQLTNGVLYFQAVTEAYDVCKRVLPSNSVEEKWDTDQIQSYLGLDPCPTDIPSDLTETSPKEGELQTVYISSDGSVEDATFFYRFAQPTENDSYDPSLRSLTIEVAKDAPPFQCGLLQAESEETSNINGVDVTVGYQRLGTCYTEDHKPTKFSDIYFSEFVYQNVGFHVRSENLTQAEFVTVLIDMIE